MNQRITYSFIHGASNETVIAPDSSNVEAFSISNPDTKDFRIMGLQLRYKAGLEDCNIELKTNNSKTLINGKVQFSQVGNKTTADIVRDELPIDFTLRAKTDLKVIVDSKSVQINKEDINITLFGNLVD